MEESDDGEPFDIESALPGYTLMPGSGAAAGERIAYELVDREGRLFGLARSYADRTLLYAVAVEDGRAGAPCALAGHHWFREVDGALRPVVETGQADASGPGRGGLFGRLRRR